MRRRCGAGETPLAPSVRIGETDGVTSGPVRACVVVDGAYDV
jgi:hypothetical protein